MVWTQFWDMHSGGRTKEGNYDKIYIEAPKQEAISVFYSKFGHSPNRVSCTCCGEDYVIDEYPTLAEASGYHRGCLWENGRYVEKQDPKTISYEPYMTLQEYIQLDTVKIITEDMIFDDERNALVPKEGYIWV